MPDPPRKVLGWRAWLAERPDGRDLRIVDSRRAQFADLANVQVIMLYRADGTRHVMCGTDYYWLAAQCCTSHDDCFGSGDEFPPDACVVVEGKELREDAYEDIRVRAHACEEF